MTLHVVVFQLGAGVYVYQSIRGIETQFTFKRPSRDALRAFAAGATLVGATWTSSRSA